MRFFVSLIYFCLSAAMAVSGWKTEAKAFSFKTEAMAAYVRGGGGISRVAQDTYGNSSGAAIFADEPVKFNLLGEIGAQFTAGALNIRLGLEALRPKETLIEGKNSSSTTLFTLTSAVFAYSPTLTFEYIYSALNIVRFYGFLSAGYSFVTLDNKYEMTAAGTAAFTPATSYTEKADGTAMGGVLGMGFETLFVDNATFSFDVGYRHLVVNNFKHKGTGAIIGDSSINKGDPVLNQDGNARKLDLGGLTIGAMFRFYIN